VERDPTEEDIWEPDVLGEMEEDIVGVSAEMIASSSDERGEC
jgi:hypothetical protein